MDDWFDTLDEVFPYPYRGWGCLLSRAYKRKVQTLYRNAGLGFKLVDGGLSALFFLGECVLVVGLIYTLAF